MLTKSEVCRRCNCSPSTVDKFLEPAERTSKGHALYREEEVLEFATDRHEAKLVREDERARRKALRERYESDPDYRDMVDRRTETRRINRERRRKHILSQPLEKVASWGKQGWLKYTFRKDEVENLIRAGENV